MQKSLRASFARKPAWKLLKFQRHQKAVKGKTKCLRTDKAEAKGVRFPKITTFRSISIKLMEISQNWLEERD